MILLLLILIHNFRIVRTIEDQTNNEEMLHRVTTTSLTF